jgi:hypothetical protein
MAYKLSTPPLFQVSTEPAASNQTIPAPEAPMDHAAHPTTSAATPPLTASPLTVAKLPTANVPTTLATTKLRPASTDNAAAMLPAQAVLGMELAATDSDSAPRMRLTV